MRLIDADAFRERFRNGEASTKEEMLWNHTVRRMIEEQPTVDAVPVVRGEWKQLYEDGEDEAYACSICGKIWFLYGTPVDNGMNYCPKCGADMRKKVD